MNWLDENGKRITIKKQNYIAAIDEIICEMKKRINDDSVWEEQYYMQDGTSSHTAKETMEFKKFNFGQRFISLEVNEEGLYWPLSSCETNVLDRNIWGIMEKDTKYANFNDVWELQALLEELSDKLDSNRELVKRCIYQFRDVCEAIIEAEGGNVDWKKYHKKKEEREGENKNTEHSNPK